MATNRYKVEYSPNGRAKCCDKDCKKAIAKGDVRIAKISPNPFAEGETMNKYFHAECIFSSFKRVRKGTKIIESADDIEDWDTLEEADQQEVLSYMGGGGSSGGKAKKSTKSKKAQKEESDADDSEEEEEGDDDAMDADDEDAGETVLAYLEMTTKFWTVRVKGSVVTAQYGKIGANGATTVKEHGTHEQAVKEAEKLIRQKRNKGYEDEELPDYLKASAGGKTAKAKPKAKAAPPKVGVKRKAPTKSEPPAKKVKKTEGDEPLHGVTIAISGTLSTSRAAFTKIVNNAGGKVAGSVTRAVQYLVTTEKEVEDGTSKVRSAQSSKVPLVCEDFVLESIEKGELLPVRDYLIGGEDGDGDDGDSAGDDDGSESDEEPPPPPKKKAAPKKAAPKKAAPKKAAPKKESGGGGGMPLAGITIAISGTLSTKRADFMRMVKNAGGQVASSVTKKVQYLVTTEDEVAKGTTKTAKAAENGIPFVAEDFVTDSIESGKLLDVDDYTVE